MPRESKNLSWAYRYLNFQQPDSKKRRATLQLESLEGRELLTASLPQASGSILEIEPTPHGIYFTSVDSRGDEELQFLPIGGTSAVKLATFAVASSASPTRGVTLAGGVLIGANLIFQADGNTGDGRQPWLATPNGASELKNLSGGAPSSDPSDFLRVGNRIFFTAKTMISPGVIVSELFETNGTSQGTVEVVPANSGATRLQSPTGLTILGTSLLFAATSYSGSTPVSTGVWDVAFSTTAANELTQTGPGAAPANINAAGSLAYFTVNSGGQAGLWQTDGTASGTAPVLTTDAMGLTNPSNLTVVGNSLFLQASKGSAANSLLWQVNHTSTVTTASAITEIPAGETLADTFGSSSDFFYILRDNAGLKLEHINSATPAPGIVAQLSNDPLATVADSTFLNNTLFVSVFHQASAQFTLWDSDGTTATKLVDPFHPSLETSSSVGSGFFANSGLVYFAQSSPTGGTELWASNGQTSWQVQDINPGTGSSLPHSFSGLFSPVSKTKLYFIANPSPTTSEIWQSDGTQMGTFALVTGTEYRPLISLPGPITTAPGQPVQFQVLGNDPNPAQRLTYSLDSVTAPTGATINPVTGAFSWTPDSSYVGKVLTIRVTITQNSAPHFSNTGYTLVSVTAPGTYYPPPGNPQPGNPQPGNPDPGPPHPGTPLVTVLSSSLNSPSKRSSKILGIQLTLSDAVMPSTVQNPENIQVYRRGRKNKWIAVPASSHYSAGGRSIQISPQAALTKSGSYRVVIQNLMDLSGRVFDGARHGVSGGAYIFYIRKGAIKFS